MGWVESGGRAEAGDWRLEAGGWRLEAGGWRLEAGGWRREAPMDASTLLRKPPPAARATSNKRSLLRAESRRDTPCRWAIVRNKANWGDSRLEAGDWRREAPMDASTLLHKPPPAARDTRYEIRATRYEIRATRYEIRDTRLAAGRSCETKPISAFAGCQWGAGRV